MDGQTGKNSYKVGLLQKKIKILSTHHIRTKEKEVECLFIKANDKIFQKFSPSTILMIDKFVLKMKIGVSLYLALQPLTPPPILFSI